MPRTRTTEPSDDEINAASMSTAPRRETDPNRQVERSGWQKRFQSITLDQYHAGERVDMRGPPDMKEYIGGAKLGRGPRPVREPSPTPRFDPNFPYWQKPLHERKPGGSLITYTPPQGGGEQRVRRGKQRG